jgi:hypothetical protein
MIRANLALYRYKRSARFLKANPIREVLVVAGITALLSYPNVYTHGTSTTLMAELFTDCNMKSTDPLDDVNASGLSEALCR